MHPHVFPIRKPFCAPPCCRNLPILKPTTPIKLRYESCQSLLPTVCQNACDASEVPCIKTLLAAGKLRASESFCAMIQQSTMKGDLPMHMPAAVPTSSTGYSCSFNKQNGPRARPTRHRLHETARSNFSLRPIKAQNGSSPPRNASPASSGPAKVGRSPTQQKLQPQPLRLTHLLYA